MKLPLKHDTPSENVHLARSGCLALLQVFAKVSCQLVPVLTFLVLLDQTPVRSSYFECDVAWYQCKNCKDWACADCAQCVVRKQGVARVTMQYLSFNCQ